MKEKHLLLRRLGRIQISLVLIETDPVMVRNFLNDFLVLKAEHRWDCQCIEYLAAHEEFEELSEYLEAPQYNLQIESVNFGTEEEPEYKPRLKGIVNLNSPLQP